MANETQSENFRHLVRIKNTDIHGTKHIVVGLTRIKGIGYMFSNMVCNLAGIDRTTKVGYLTKDDIGKLEEVIDSPAKYNIPTWMLNRRNDYEKGVDTHLFTSDLQFVHSNDLRRMQRTKSFRGLRLSWGLPVRGQRTKSNFRKGRGKSLGVKRKK